MLTAAREKELVSFMSFNKLVVISKANNKRNMYVYDDANDCVKALHKNFNDELDITLKGLGQGQHIFTTDRQVKIISCSADGIKRHLDKYEFLEKINQYDIICIQKTWACDEKQYNDLFNGYICYSTITKNTAGMEDTQGEILVFVKKYLSSVICAVQKSEIAITLMLKCGITDENKLLLFYFIYIPPIFSSTYDYLEEEN